MKAKHSAYPHPKARTEATTDSPSQFVRNALKSLSITLAIGTALLLALSLAAYLTPDPDALISPLGLVAAALTALLGGVVSVRVHHRHAPLPAAAVNAALLCALMLVLSLFFGALATGYSALVSALLHAAVFALSALGALLGMREKHPKRKRRP